MPNLPKLDPIDLASLMASKVCHDIISPVGAINNAIQVMADDDSVDTKQFADDLIERSAIAASDKLRFARMAFGAGGKPGSPIDTGEAEEVAKLFMAHEKADLVWVGDRMMVAKERTKLLLNLIYQSAFAVPRGGEVTATIEGRDDEATFVVRCSGKRARVPEVMLEMLNGTFEGPVTASHVQPLLDADAGGKRRAGSERAAGWRGCGAGGEVGFERVAPCELLHLPFGHAFPIPRFRLSANPGVDLRSSRNRSIGTGRVPRGHS